MADNFTFTPGSGATGAADDVGGVLHPRVKLDWGADGIANDVDTAAGKALPVQLRDSDGTDVGLSAKLGIITETAPATDTASSGLNGRLQRIAQRLTSLIALLPTSLGAGGGLKIDGSGTALPVSAADGSNTTLGSKADAKSTATDTTAVSVMSVLKQISASIQAAAASLAGTLTVGLPSGAATSANQTSIITDLGGVTETAPATDTASSGLNGRLQRIAQRLTTLIAVFPATIDTNSGTKSASTLRVVIATDQPQNTNALKVDGSAVTQPVSIAATVNVTPVPAASGGPTMQRVKAAASTNATSVKASAGQLYGYALFNNTSSAKYFKLYNKASSPTVGTDTPAFTIILPANGGANVEWSHGVPLGTGIAFAITGAVADADATAVAADDVHGVLLYK